MTAESEGKFQHETRDISIFSEGDFPGLPQQLERLHEENLGRAITTEVDIAPNKKEHRLLGYVLPINDFQTRHLILFRDGLIIVVRPRSAEEKDLVYYKNTFRPNEEVIFTSFRESKKIIGSITNNVENITNTEVVTTNAYPEQVPYIKAAIKTAMECARQLQESKSQARRETVKFLIDGIDNLFNTPKIDVTGFEDSE